MYFLVLLWCGTITFRHIIQLYITGINIISWPASASANARETLANKSHKSPVNCCNGQKNKVE